jgi:hypothetical protein
MKGTGVFATKSEIAQLKTAIQTSGMFLHLNLPSPQEECHRMALTHGLPEITGFYGIKGDGEFVTD